MGRSYSQGVSDSWGRHDEGHSSRVIQGTRWYDYGIKVHRVESGSYWQGRGAEVVKVKSLWWKQGHSGSEAVHGEARSFTLRNGSIRFELCP